MSPAQRDPMPMTVQVLMVPECGHGQQTILLVRDVLDMLAPEARLETIVIRDQGEAERHRFPGSPTVRVNGSDIEPGGAAGVGVG